MKYFLTVFGVIFFLALSPVIASIVIVYLVFDFLKSLIRIFCSVPEKLLIAFSRVIHGREENLNRWEYLDRRDIRDEQSKGESENVE